MIFIVYASVFHKYEIIDREREIQAEFYFDDT